MNKISTTIRYLALIMMSLFIASCGSSSNSNSNPASSDASLKSITIGTEILTSTDPFVYEATVGFGAQNVFVKFVTNDTAASIIVNRNTVISGSFSPLLLGGDVTNIFVKITAADGVTVQIYTLIVTTATDDPSVATLSNLELDEADLDQMFQLDQYFYTASVGFLKKTVILSATPTSTGVNGATIAITPNSGTNIVTSEGADGAIEGEIPLSEGDNTVRVEVTATDGTTQIYILNVSRSSAADFAQKAYLKANNAGAGDLFGHSVALDGDTLVVGATGESSSIVEGEPDGSALSAGAVYVFTRDTDLTDNIWGLPDILKASNAEAGDLFGHSVALNGDTLVVGATGESSDGTLVGDEGAEELDESNNDAPGAGAVYVFTREDSTSDFAQQEHLKARKAEAGDLFGHSVALDSDTLVVGATGETKRDNDNVDYDSEELPLFESEVIPSAGAVYVFIRPTASSVFNQLSQLKASNAGTGDLFGHSVAVDGDTLVVGATGQSSSAGAVYVFTLPSNDWVELGILEASNAEPGDLFGHSVALNGDTLVVGATGESSGAFDNESDNSALSAGAVYVFTLAPVGWIQQTQLKARNADNGDLFGHSLAFDGDTLVVGARLEGSRSEQDETDNLAPGAGAVYVW